MQYALPELFFAVMCAAVSKIIDHMGIGADKAEEAKTEEAKTEDTPAEDETASEEAVPSTEELNVEPAESSEEKEDAEEA